MTVQSLSPVSSQCLRLRCHSVLPKSTALNPGTRAVSGDVFGCQQTRGLAWVVGGVLLESRGQGCC